MVRVKPYLRLVDAMELGRRLQDEIAVLNKAVEELEELAEKRAKILAEIEARVAIIKKELAELKEKIARRKEKDESIITLKEAAIGFLSGVAIGTIAGITIKFVLKKGN